MDLTIVNDNVLEMDESFNVSLESIQALNNHDKINRIHIISANAEINIIGGDCTYVIHSNTCMCIDRWVGAGPVCLPSLHLLLWSMHVTLPLFYTAPYMPLILPP